ncbi:MULTISPECIES: DUF2285 domain-containing protein [Rhodocyclales]|uniref:DUF2285 domain-containing protein n=1 Tax=Zoogloea oryzae TaxID=310767 RepID=A0ABQ6FA99_9RHOO|nr:MULTISPECIES: DUF2285 domain-containing protein [Rhodocyclales]GLT22194.1 hypothetical protein GCM10007933_16520 [Zoogloea oryzae]
MVDRSAESWYPTAAYLYVLHLDDLALAWEYLRRHPDYRRDWLRRLHQPDAAHHWGLRMLEDPTLDARDAHPAWFPGHPCTAQLHSDIDPPQDAVAFEFWRIPGQKQLIHDGRRLMLATQWPGCCLRLTLAPNLVDGMAYVYAIRACDMPCARHCMLRVELDKLAVSSEGTPAAVVRPRPAPTTLQELNTLQALDATLAGASLREIAEGLFGVDAVVAGWYADGGLRSRVRRLVRRGLTLMRGGYRRLARVK